MPPTRSTDPDGDLPFIDEHHVLVSASAGAVWRCLAMHIPRFAGGQAFADLLAAAPSRAAGTPLDEGARVPGFAVAESVPERRVRLTGQHRFSRYALVLTLDEEPDGTRLTARTYARFFGLSGRLYRWLVIGSGAHAILVARLLRSVRRQAGRADVA